MIDTLLKWIIWPFWKPYLIIRDGEDYGDGFDRDFWFICIKKSTRIVFSTYDGYSAAEKWAFEHLDWRGRLKATKGATEKRN